MNNGQDIRLWDILDAVKRIEEKLNGAGPDSFAAGVEAAAKAIAAHKPDASFDDSQSGVIERQALLANIIAEVRALAPSPLAGTETERWAKEWHAVVDTIVTVLGLPDGIDAHEVAGAVRAKFEAERARVKELTEALEKERRLREEEYQIALHLRQEQHAKLDAITARVEELAEALEPFEELVEDYIDHGYTDDKQIMAGRMDRAGAEPAPRVTFADFKRVVALARSRAEGI